jgi:ribonuclease HI
MRNSKQKQRELLRQYQDEQHTVNSSPSSGNIVAYFDGACEPRNPGGNMGIGATIRQAGKELFRHSSFAKAAITNSNNVAEYMAFEAILDFMILNKWTGQVVAIYGDSKLVINQMFGTWRIKDGFYVPFAKRCIPKLQQLSAAKNKITGVWINRDRNGYADELSKAELINHNVQFRIQPLHLNPSN